MQKINLIATGRIGLGKTLMKGAFGISSWIMLVFQNVVSYGGLWLASFFNHKTCQFFFIDFLLLIHLVMLFSLLLDKCYPAQLYALNIKRIISALISNCQSPIILFYKNRLIIVPIVRLILFPRWRCLGMMQLVCVCTYTDEI